MSRRPVGCHGTYADCVRLDLDAPHPDAVRDGFTDGYAYALRLEWLPGPVPAIEIVAPD